MGNQQENRSGSDTIAAIATALGRAGIGIIRLSGTEAPNIAEQLTRSVLNRPRQAILCDFLDERDMAIDRGILIYYPQPASYTGEHVVELHGHGGAVPINLLLSRVIALGARQARPGEFTERAFLNDKIDLLQAEATAALINSASSEAAESAIRSLQGEFSELINNLLKKLIDLRVLIEGLLDFPDEEKDFLAQAKPELVLTNCIIQLDKLTTETKHKTMLEQGLQMVIVGAPNVGKSTLFNKMAGKSAAIVSSMVGTTRDLLDQNILVDGIPLTIMDTAGLRATQDDIERQGIERAMEAARQANIILLLLDEQGYRGAQQLSETYPEKTIIVRNKVDLLDKGQQLLEKNNHLADIYLSAKTGVGIDDLMQRLRTTIAELNSTDGNTGVARSRHFDALLETRRYLSQGLLRLQKEQSLELLAEELRLAQDALGKITGRFVSEDLLGEIFANFCIGK